MKNELILASKTGPGHRAQRERAGERLQQVLDELGLQALRSRFGPAEDASA
jgi:hypothetical protein